MIPPWPKDRQSMQDKGWLNVWVRVGREALSSDVEWIPSLFCDRYLR